jgi:predicted outer membrane lipoprotein
MERIILIAAAAAVIVALGSGYVNTMKRTGERLMSATTVETVEDRSRVNWIK